MFLSEQIGAECQNRTDLISLEGWVLTLSNPAFWSILLELNQSNRVCNPAPKPLGQRYIVFGRRPRTRTEKLLILSQEGRPIPFNRPITFY